MLSKGQAGWEVLRCLARTALFLAGLAGVLACLYLVGYRHYHVGDYALADAVFERTPNLDFVVLGSSHARGIKPDLLGPGGANFAVNGQDMFEVAYKAEAVAPRLVGRKVVFVSVSYFSFLCDNAAFREKGKATRAERRLDLYAGFPRLSFIDGDFDNYVKGTLHPLVTLDHWERVFSGSGAEAAPPGKYTEPKQTEAKLRRQSKGRCREHAHIIQSVLKNRPDVSVDLLRETEAMVEGLKDRGARVVFFTTPVYQDYDRCFRKQWKANMYANMKRVVRDSGAEYYDYSKDKDFASNPKVFWNCDHLNTPGVKLLTEKIRRDTRFGG